MIWLREDLKGRFPGDDAFDKILHLEGEVFRELAGRRTLKFVLGGKSYFAKLHFGVGWKEIFKNLIHFRLPVLGAEHEWRAIRRFEELGVATMTLAAYGRRGWNPARQESFVITEELVNTISLEDLCRDWPRQPLPASIKRALLREVAETAKALHNNGVNHRDFYLCHFLLDRSWLDTGGGCGKPKLHVIDLHRVQLRDHTPSRWVIKDLAGLFFSSMDAGLTKRDYLRFVKCYRNSPLRQTLALEKSFWIQVTNRAVKLYQREFGRSPHSLPFAM